jgi:predicted dehydrogenase
VQAQTGTLNHDIEVDDVSMALVKFENGAFGSFVNSAVSPRQETHLRLDFQRATVEVKGLYSAANQDWHISGVPGTEPPEWSISENVPGILSAQLIALLDSLDMGERPLVSGAESRRILEFTTGLYQSAFTGSTVQRASLTPDNRFYHSTTGAV